MGKCAKVCDCNVTVSNTAVGCVPLMKVEKRKWLVSKYDSTGALNYIDLAVTLDDDFFADMINSSDPLARVCPLPELKNIADARDKPVIYEWKDGSKVRIRDGIRAFDGMFPPEAATPQLAGVVESWSCVKKPCQYGIDADGTIWGKISSDGTKLYPIELDPQSIAAIFTKPTDTEPQMLGMSFNFHPSEKDCELRGIMVSELTGGINPLDYDGLMDVYIKVISCTATKLKFKLFNAFGTAINPETIKNLLVANFTLRNVTDSSDIALTGSGAAFAEAPAGTYELTYATADQPTVADVLKLTPAKDGYDFTSVIATSIAVA